MENLFGTPACVCHRCGKTFDLGRIVPFCSDACNDAWKTSGGDANPFEYLDAPPEDDTPREREVRLRRAFVAWYGPQPLRLWRHYKGDAVEIIVCSIDEETGQPLVTYRHAADFRHMGAWTRPLAVFLAAVEQCRGPDGGVIAVPRFTPV